MAWLRDERDHAPSSLARFLVVVRMFMRFLVEERLVKHDRVQLVQGPKQWLELPEVLSIEEVDRLLKSAPGRMYTRDRTALELLYACGARASEVIGLDIADIREQSSFVRLRGKGNKERMVPLGTTAKKQLQRYLRELRPELVGNGKGGDAILLGARGGRLSRNQLWMIVKQAAVLAGIRKRVFTHLLRHSFATHMIERGADLRIVQELLGHANMTTTQRYTHVDAKRLRAVHQQFHPRA